MTGRLGKLLFAQAFFIVPGAVVIGWTTTNWTEAFRVAARSFVLTTLLLLFAWRYPPSAWLGHMRRIGIPPFLADIVLVTCRFIILLSDTARKIRRAQEARLGYATTRSSRRSSALLAANLFRVSIERGKRLQAGLDARCDRGELRVLAP